ncbi:O-methyltransferase [Sphingomonas sp. URHD0057]|uniref:O-methyltransferase n=1 Tax=Sphingomonas sp. URHD0057 TaxID=1380389 RepID=UPI00048DD92A|nr:O-methyltransferase [Sphingomonas sp. URHD0057]
MSGAALPYRLRPNKAVDRRLFMDLLLRCERYGDMVDHAYVSMAAYALEDQKLVHRLLGITRLLAFDMDAGIVARQEWNRPIDECKCRQFTSGALVADVDSALQSSGINDAEGYIVWLDYTAPKDLFVQIREFETLVGQFKHRDVVRVTVNAEYGYWSGPNRIAGKPVAKEQLQKNAFERMKSVLGEYFPSNAKEQDMGPELVASIISRAFGKAAGNAVSATTGDVLEPLSITRYADGQQMLSMTAMRANLLEASLMRARLGLSEWPFASSAWSDVKYLAVADLTIRERLYLERNSSKSASQIESDVGFNFDVVTEMPGFLENFKTYYRHYPALTPVEL